jgi:hypothetical protein
MESLATARHRWPPLATPLHNLRPRLATAGHRSPQSGSPPLATALHLWWKTFVSTARHRPPGLAIGSPFGSPFGPRHRSPPLSIAATTQMIRRQKPSRMGAMAAMASGGEPRHLAPPSLATLPPPLATGHRPPPLSSGDAASGGGTRKWRAMEAMETRWRAVARLATKRIQKRIKNIKKVEKTTKSSTLAPPVATPRHFHQMASDGERWRGGRTRRAPASGGERWRTSWFFAMFLILFGVGSWPNGSFPG